MMTSKPLLPGIVIGLFIISCIITAEFSGECVSAHREEVCNVIDCTAMYTVVWYTPHGSITNELTQHSKSLCGLNTTHCYVAPDYDGWGPSMAIDMHDVVFVQCGLIVGLALTCYSIAVIIYVCCLFSR